MRRLVLLLAVACATSLAAPGRLSNDQQTRDAVDEFSRWRDTRKPVQQDVGQQTEDLRQQYEDIEQHFAEMGQQLESMGRQVEEETGQQTLDLGQQLEEVRQLLLAPSTTEVARVSLSEEDVGQVLDTPVVTQRPKPSTARPTTTVPVRANPVQMQRTVSSTRAPTVHQIVQESTGLNLLAGQVISNNVTEKPAAVRGDQISVSGEDLDAGQQLEKLSVSGEQESVPIQVTQAPKAILDIAGQVSVSGEEQQGSQTNCVGGIIIGTVCYQSWDSQEEHIVQSTTGRPQATTPKATRTTPTQATTTTVRPTTPRITAPVARAMSSSRTTTTTTVQPEITTTEKAPARLSVSEEQIDDQTPSQIVQHRPQQMRRKPKVVGQVDNSSEEGGLDYEDAGQQPEPIQQRPEPVQYVPRPVHQRPTAVPQLYQPIRQKPHVVGQVDNSSEEGQQSVNLEQRPQAVRQRPDNFRQSSEEAGQIIYKPDFPEQSAARVVQVDDSSEEVGQVQQRPEVFSQLQVTPSRSMASTTVRPATPRRVGQLQDPNVEGSEELGRIASYIRDKVNEDQDEDYDAGQQTVQNGWQNFGQLAQQVDVRAGQQPSSGSRG